MESSNNIVSIEGPIEFVDGELQLRIPLEAGGEQLAPFAEEIGTIEDEYLKVIIRPWLAERLRIHEGTFVVVDNANGKFSITRSENNED
jgi:hypothetical protein